MKKDRVLVTGANGFVGRALIYTLLKRNFSIRILTHSTHSAQRLKDEVSGTLSIYSMNDLVKSEQWETLFEDIDTVIHCGAQLHPTHTDESQQQFMTSNYDVTLNLANRAAHHGVRRFIFLSSMSVFGNMKQHTPFTEETSLTPIDAYGLSKLKAEQGLREIADKIELVIIRPPLVYGPNVKNNFKKLFTLVNKGLPLPLGAIKNKRHFIGINNLIDFIIVCIAADKAKNETFIIADKEALSTTELINQIGRAMHKKSILIPIPSKILKLIFKLTGLSKLSDQLFYNIEIDFSKANKLLNWTPPYSLQEELQLSVNHFLEEKKKTA
ncbi:UDP-glucose 4-epimerase [Legionella antarctica]|uniref:UDP-glucose 4-epimerase n=1 Tax=Legionella antarctica TaxID=2708020 RepID=A0A6F8T2N7_9GAMM|nr:NAD-dependent epimerase/dehydratase family protein [Legionella antarctica]BCA94944.1 UDP-glucose 4-epimerase [Legionella antarctica]